MDNNQIRVANVTASQGLQISTQSINQAISATNNKALYYAEQAKKYKDEAKTMRDLAQYYAEQNSDVTVGYINGIKTALETKIDAKQDAGNYALSSDLPTNISDLTDDTTTNPIDKADTLTGLTATVTELNYCDGVTSNIQTQLDSKLSGNTAITASTTNKVVTYDEKGLVTGGSDLSSSVITTALGFTPMKTDFSNSDKPYLKTCYVSGTSGYNIWSNGYCEQWGRASHSSGSGAYASVTFLKTWANTNYAILSFPYGVVGSAGSGYFNIATISATTTSVRLVWDFDTDPSSVAWRACGYLASGQY